MARHCKNARILKRWAEELESDRHYGFNLDLLVRDPVGDQRRSRVEGRGRRD